MSKRVLVYNGVICKSCNEVLVSYHRHDCKTCLCENKTTIDGGLEYIRYGGKNVKLVELKSVYSTDDFEIVRRHAYWGTRGKNGNERLKYVKLYDMSDEHLQALVRYLNKNHYFKDLVFEEIEYRKNLIIGKPKENIISEKNKLPNKNYVRHVITGISRAFRRKFFPKTF